jgi:hypothetical protein
MLTSGQPDGFEVLRLDQEGIVQKRYHVLPGVPERRLRAVAAVHGQLWICLDRGVYRLRP